VDLEEFKLPGRLSFLIEFLPLICGHHAPSDPAYLMLKDHARHEIEAAFGQSDRIELGPFGEICLPYHQMGNVDSIDLFALDELIIFSFYWANRKRYRKAADFGANIGLHTCVLSRCGFDVHSFEPDPAHFEVLSANIDRNGLTNAMPFASAVSTSEGEHEFIRIVNNTTGGHLAGAKFNPYGPMDRFSVQTVLAAPHIEWADLIKMDIEGHEADVLCATSGEDWQTTDAIVEVGNTENASAIFNHFSQIGINLFAQKTGWMKVVSLEDMPTSHRDGSLFISAGDKMNWAGR
jgi:FkbM family methyltransferase